MYARYYTELKLPVRYLFYGNMTSRAGRKSKDIYGNWEESSMKLAAQAVQEKKMGFLKAAKEFKVPKTTLRRHVNSKNKVSKNGKKHIGRTPDLPEIVERQLVEHILQMEARFYGLTLSDVRKLAFDIAKANNLTTRFNQEKKLAGNDWLMSFLKRHPEISLRAPQATSLARASGFNKTQVNAFYDLLEETITQNNISPDRIFNMDESGLSVVQKVSKILGKKGKHQMGAITSQERSQTITIICCVSAAGYFIPPGMIFPRKRMKGELKDGAPCESIFFCQVRVTLNFNIV